MVTNGIVSLPSSQFIYVTAGFLVPSGKLEFIPVVIIGTLGNMIGNAILYEVSRRKGLTHITRWRGFSMEGIMKLRQAFRYRGSVIIFIGKFLPGIKVVVPVVAGIVRMNRMLYSVIIAVTSFLWALGLTYFGVYFGKNYGDGTFGWYSGTLIVLAIIAMYSFYKYVHNISLKEVIEK